MPFLSMLEPSIDTQLLPGFSRECCRLDPTKAPQTGEYLACTICEAEVEGALAMYVAQSLGRCKLTQLSYCAQPAGKQTRRYHNCQAAHCMTFIWLRAAYCMLHILYFMFDP